MSDGNVVERSSEDCLSAAQDALLIYENMTKDDTLIHAFWWTTYVVYSAVSVVLIWQIQQLRSNSPMVLQQYRDIIELAERCRDRMASTAVSGTHTDTYLWILNELKHEITVRSSHDPHVKRNGSGSHSPESYVASERSDPFYNWQPTDWLDLDSAVSRRFHNSVMARANSFQAFESFTDMV